ncbi:hypothetical protein MSAN_00634200 [Mycena sanguinolenta]|uniref:Uncharacterized protein n=1 Tax=Mycena sanguinolenta TaxID=230812 RepID=A0A8H6Z3K0_9AGAR|nr:hypothetical protein MSAN_00634200 [Mycena sanguinolenta]
MMLIGIIAPEIMVGFAAGQRLEAHELSKDFNFSTTHGMFFCMGGFVSLDGHPIATRGQLEDPVLGPDFQKSIRNINEEDIMDKSKGDALSKGVALLQGMWFILHCVARVPQHLAVTQLEVATLAFAVVNITSPSTSNGRSSSGLGHALHFHQTRSLCSPRVTVSTVSTGCTSCVQFLGLNLFGYQSQSHHFGPYRSTTVWACELLVLWP